MYEIISGKTPDQKERFPKSPTRSREQKKKSVTYLIYINLANKTHQRKNNIKKLQNYKKKFPPTKN